MSQLKILIVDDNQDLANGLGTVLEYEGYQVTLAYNGNSGIKAFEAENFDLVFLDVKLPDMNGVEVFQNIHKKNPETRVIMMTGYRVEQLLAETIEDGEVELLRKPFKIERVFEILGEIKNESIVLIADDDPGLPESLSSYLTGCGMKTLHARNGQEAVDGMELNPAEILLLNLRKPIMNSLGVYLKLRQRGHAVKTIIVTGYEDQESNCVDVLRSTSVTGCLFKPFKTEEMLGVIDQYRLEK